MSSYSRHRQMTAEAARRISARQRRVSDNGTSINHLPLDLQDRIIEEANPTFKEIASLRAASKGMYFDKTLNSKLDAKTKIKREYVIAHMVKNYPKIVFTNAFIDEIIADLLLHDGFIRSSYNDPYDLKNRNLYIDGVIIKRHMNIFYINFNFFRSGYEDENETIDENEIVKVIMSNKETEGMLKQAPKDVIVDLDRSKGYIFYEIPDYLLLDNEYEYLQNSISNAPVRHMTRSHIDPKSAVPQRFSFFSKAYKSKSKMLWANGVQRNNYMEFVQPRKR